MSLFVIVALEDREKRSRERRAERGKLELPSREHAKNCIITPAKIYANLYNFVTVAAMTIRTPSLALHSSDDTEWASKT